MAVNPNTLSPFVTLDAGESEAIVMALEWPADLLIMDESSGRTMARKLNIRITGTLGVLLKAKRDGQILHSAVPENPDCPTPPNLVACLHDHHPPDRR
jgi:predicted nucleic acid-binding protein